MQVSGVSPICVGLPYLRARPQRSVEALLRTPAATAATRRDCRSGPGVFLSPTPRITRVIVSGGRPVTDVAYLCHNCGSVHEVESIRENLILDLRTAASYQPSEHRGMLDPRTRFLRWRMTQGLAQALWPGYSRYPWLAWGRRLMQRPTAPVSDRPVPCRAAASGSDARAGNPA
jgi:hypothetical protein